MSHTQASVKSTAADRLRKYVLANWERTPSGRVICPHCNRACLGASYTSPWSQLDWFLKLHTAPGHIRK